MTVLQEHPEPFLHAISYRSLSKLPLTLTQRDLSEGCLEPKFISEVDNLKSRISAGTQDEYQRRLSVALREGLFQIEGRWLDVTFSHLTYHETLYTELELIREQYANQHELEGKHRLMS